jgi:hypothetical protein
VSRRPLLLALAAWSLPALGQGAELALVGGYTSPGRIENKAPQFQDLELAGSFTWGVQLAHELGAHQAVELSWSRQESALAFATLADEGDLFELTADQIHASFVYRFGAADARLRPFVLAGLGATLFSAPDSPTETKLSGALGGGLRWLGTGRFGAGVQARYNPTYLDDASSDFCDPFGFCQSWLHQFEVLAGVVVRF